ncbi:class I adenylate cyclase [Gilvimarinus sp. SDUM040013]|uniref:Class I adenylate cyclase n=1 Tax=Gilvimarinus gilvus TaxID=3058038 RepID=A0ABU4S553_9GAMM|nr:class I adenylate cyclase [Gilvimarinus sp. SDUM040013]MDO3384413.1 class I adenylate cyclase [Gilvimarinus sp. SDUM040013]MDX6851018.1 class I adenylate cyclase [Gilvimarinus sp. SDUM040013]
MSDFSEIHPDNGIDRKQLKQIKQRFLDLNSARLDRTREAIGIRQQLFLDVLPLLLHVNHPMLPGYQGASTPCGIPYFKPDPIQISAAKIVARSFELKKNYSQRDLAIDAVFIMGSVGTIAHSERSDFDIWVCHKPKIRKDDLTKLIKKCEDISVWAEQELGVEAHFFPVYGDNPDVHQASSSMSTESSGSAQQHLLLDEFYRSAIWIAGKVPLWWYVPVREESNYNYFTQQLLHKRFVRKQDVVDFGPITHIPHQEYLGAGIWQLYKGINSPHKSVLKLMLLEAYASQGKAKPLALDFKEEIHKKCPEVNDLDGYLLIYYRIEDYFQRTDQQQRLELARRCFYFKVDKPLTRPPTNRQKSWQRLILEHLVESWGWDNTQLLRLDSHKLWKANRVIQERDLLIKELSQSYRLLGGLSRQSFEEATISSQELAILGRKLHAAFERKSGKIEKINPEISKDLSEAFLTLRQSQHHQRKWKLYRDQRSYSDSTSRQRVQLYESESLHSSLIWAICNGVLDTATHIDIIGDRLLQEPEKRCILQRTLKWLPRLSEQPSHDAFLEAAIVTKVQAAINLTITPYETLDKQGLKLLSEQSDALNYSGLHDNLVQSVDLAHLNSWHEIIVRSYKKDALSQFILAYLRFAPPHLIDTPPDIDIVCPDQQFGALIENRLCELISRIKQCFYGNNGNPYARYLIETHRQFYVVQFHQNTPSIIRLHSTEELFEYLETPQAHDRPLILDSMALLNTSIRSIIETVKPGSHYLYYEVNEDQVLYTYSDVSGALFRFSATHLEKNAFPTPILSFIAAVNARLSSQGGVFSLEHFDSMSNVKRVGIRRVSKKGQKYVVEEDAGNTLSSNITYTDIKVIVEPDDDGQLHYTIFCDNEVYRDENQDPFEKAAKYIASQRQGRQSYHCYINDLDLTACAELIAPETGLQLLHYLQQKRLIENRLNHKLSVLNSDKITASH